MYLSFARIEHIIGNHFVGGQLDGDIGYITWQYYLSFQKYFPWLIFLIIIALLSSEIKRGYKFLKSKGEKIKSV